MNAPSGSESGVSENTERARRKALLAAHFAVSPFPSREAKDNIAKDVGMTTGQVVSWFKHERTRKGISRPKDVTKSKTQKLRPNGKVAAKIAAKVRELRQKCTGIITGVKKAKISIETKKEKKKEEKKGKKKNKSLSILIDEYEGNQLPDYETLKELAKRTKMNYSQVNEWFSNRRRAEFFKFRREKALLARPACSN